MNNLTEIDGHTNEHAHGGCETNPEHIPAADPLGHWLPGLIIMAAAFYVYWVMLSRHFKAKAPGSAYKFDGSPVNLTLPFLDRWPFELILLIAFSTLAISSFVFKIVLLEGNSVWGSLKHWVNEDHMPIYVASYTYFVTAMLHERKCITVPEHAAQICLASFTFALCGVLYSHLVGRCVYDTEMHKMFGFLPALATTASFTAQIWRRESFLLAVAASFWLNMCGLGLIVIGLLGWVLPGISSEWRAVPTERKTRDMPRLFFLTFDAMLIAYLLIYTVFAKLRGERLGKRNPVYAYHKNGEEDGLGSYVKADSVDEEKSRLLMH